MPTKISGAYISKTSPLISVILPAFNAENYIADAVKSILKQSYCNFEFIIIDDGSTDNTLPILQKYARLDSRILLISRENRRLVATLNEMVDLAKGDWIARMDADDISHPERFQRQLNLLKLSGADICGSWIKFFGDNSNRIWRTHESNTAIKTDMLFKCPLAHPSVMIRAGLLKKLKYRSSYIHAEDYDLWVRSAMGGFVFANVPDVLLSYRVHANQISTKTLNDQNKAAEKIRFNYWSYLAKSGLVNSGQAESISRLIAATRYSCLNFSLANDGFERVLSSIEGESRKVFINNVCMLYLKLVIYFPRKEICWKDFGKTLPWFTYSMMCIKIYIIDIFARNLSAHVLDRLKSAYNQFRR
jgi:glycosyltransferase involved in cell wall biosynthesis